MSKVNITSPVGRLVMGSLYDPRTTDAEGKPLAIKHGPNAGQPRVDYFFALAIPKEAGHTHWSQTEWGRQIYQVGAQAFPQAHQAPIFAWKIEDGDSQIPNRRGKKPCDNEGFRGHWVLKFSGGFAPRVYKNESGRFVQVLEKDFLKPGYFAQVAFSVDGNGSQSQPGIYLNHQMICFTAYGQEIVFGPDVESAGFGVNVALPVGATMTPPASTIPMPAAPAPLAPVGFVPPPAAPAPIAAAPIAAAPIAAAPIPVAPNPQFLQVPVPPAAPAAPVPPAAPVKQMTAAANGVTYEAYIASGWTDALLIQNGLMQP